MPRQLKQFPTLKAGKDAAVALQSELEIVKGFNAQYALRSYIENTRRVLSVAGCY